MRVLHVGNFSLRAKGAFLHSVAPKLSRGLVRAGHQVVDFSDRDAARASTPFLARKLGTAGANRALLQLARDMEPDLLLLGHADTISARTIATLRHERPALRVLQWNVDPIFEPDNIARLKSKQDVVDATLVSTAGEALAILRHKTMRLGFLPNPVDFSIETGQAHMHEALPYDLFYACGHPSRPKREIFGRNWDMERFLKKIMDALPRLRPCLAGLFDQPHLAGAPYQEALASSAAGLNISRRQDHFLYSSDRLAHMIGNGQAILMDRETGYDRLFGNDQMGFFQDMRDLTDILAAWIAEPALRCRTAAAGRARYHQLFNETRIARYIVEVAFGAHDPGAYEWPTLVA